jgi:hypothetical protein
MSITTLNIQSLIENNPLSIVSDTSKDKLINRMSEIFTSEHQKLFLSSFYCYLNYNSRTDYVIDLDLVWKFLGFSQKIRAKELLLKHFEENKDFKIEKIAFSIERARYNKDTTSIKEKITLNIRTFKSICLKANTEKAKEIHDYYIDLEETIMEITRQETELLKRQTDNLLEQTCTLQNELKIAKSRVQQRHTKTYNPGRALYVLRAKTNNTHFKVGYTNNLENRLSQYRTGNPDQEEYYFQCFWYSPFSYEIEQLLLKAFQPDKINMNSEWISLNKLSDLEHTIQEILRLFSSDTQQTTEKQTIIPIKTKPIIPCENCNEPVQNNKCNNCEMITCTLCKLQFSRNNLPEHREFCEAIYQIDPDTLKIIQEWNNAGDAASGDPQKERYIRDACFGRKTTAMNFSWVWKNKPSTYLDSLQVKYNDVLYNSLTEASTTTNTPKHEIKISCLTDTTTINSFVKPKQSSSAIKHCKKIIQLKPNGEITKWDSTVSAAKYTRIDKSSIIRCCKGKQKTAGNCEWNYIG